MDIRLAKRKILQLYPNMIGKNNAKTIIELYEHVFDKGYISSMQSKYEIHFYIKPALRRIRNNIGYFIVPIKINNQIRYCVPSNMSELEDYKNVLKSNIIGCQTNLQKAYDFVKMYEQGVKIPSGQTVISKIKSNFSIPI